MLSNKRNFNFTIKHVTLYGVEGGGETPTSSVAYSTPKRLL